MVYKTDFIVRFSLLPPFDYLVAFEATARHGSFTKAAKELCITQSAVSRRVAQLEKHIGRTLINREYRTLKLTITGQQYLEQIQRQLIDMADATYDVMKSRDPMMITIACASGTASLWLAPRLPEFIQRYPNVKTRIVVQESIFLLKSFEFDIGIYYLRSPPPKGFVAQSIIKEKVYAVCSPDYLSRQRLKPDDLMHETLLVADERQREWMGWHHWFSLCGIQNINLKKTITANQYLLLVQLAIQGQGIVLGWENMIDPLINAGVLVYASDAFATFGGGYCLVWPQDRSDSLPVRYFQEWMSAKIKTASSRLILPIFHSVSSFSDPEGSSQRTPSKFCYA